MPTHSLVLAIEPDLRQAAIVKRIVREKVGAEVTVVDSRDAAIEAMRTAVPDVLLISALLSPRDEDDLIAHLRTLENAQHLQTHTIPQLASALGPGERRSARGLLSAFRRKKELEHAPSGCDPDLFASEIRTFLQRAAEKKRDLAEAHASGRISVTPRMHAPAAEPAAEVAAAPEPVSSWASPFEWRPTSDRSSLGPNPASSTANPGSSIPHRERSIQEPATDAFVAPQPIVEEPFRALPEPDLEPVSFDEPVPEEPSLEAAEPVHADEPVPPEPIVAVEPIHTTEPIYATEPIHPPEPIREAELIREPEPIQVAQRSQDSGLTIRDAPLEIQDQGLGMHRKLGPLASWARAEGRVAETPTPTGDLRGLLSGLAVPPAVAGVGYAAGCRIRRVRVAPAREGGASRTKGAVILSKRALAEIRDRREQPQP